MSQIESIELPISFDSYTTEPVSILKPISRINFFLVQIILGKDVDQYLEYVLSYKPTNYSKVLNLLSPTLPQNEIEALT